MKRLLLKKTIALAVLGAVMLAMIVLGVVLCFMGMLFTPACFMSFFVIPGITLLTGSFLIFSNIKPLAKKIWFVVLICGFFVSMFLSLLGKYEMLTTYENEDISAPYTEMREIYPSMPVLDSVGVPSNMEYHEYFTMVSSPSSGCSCAVLICQYTEQDYAEQEQLVNQRYVFSKEARTFSDHPFDPITEIDGYIFRLVDTEVNSVEQWQNDEDFVVVAMNDVTNEIVYLSFFAENAHTDSTVDFINQNCGWQKMRQ